MSASTTNTGLTIRNIPLFAARTRRTLQYYSTGTVLTGTNTVNSQVFSANGMFDPDITGSGGQPMGFDQMMAFYNHYTVLRSRIRIIIANTSTTLTPSVGIMVSGSASVTSSIEQMVENGDVAFAQLSYAGAFGATSRFSRSLVIARFQGVDDPMDVTDLSGDSASNPAEQAYYHVCTWNPYSATQITSNWQVVIEYEAVFHEPKKGPLS